MSAVRRAAQPIGRPIRRFAIGRRTKAWPPYSRLFVAGDGEEWAITDDARQIARLAATPRRRGRRRALDLGRPRPVDLLREPVLAARTPSSSARTGLASRTSTAAPGRRGCRSSTPATSSSAAGTSEIDRIQVPSRAMEELVLGAGVPREKVFRIPIGIDLDRFRPRTAADRTEARRRLGLPADAFVAGSSPEGRRRLGRRARAEADQRPGRVARGGRAPARAGARALRSAHRPRARLRDRRGSSGLGVAYRHVLLDDLDDVARRVRRARRVSRHLARRGWAEGRARVDGDRCTACDDAGRPGGGSRPRRRERLSRRGRRCGGGGRRRGTGRRTRPRQSSRPWSRLLGRRRRPARTRRSRRAWRSLLDGFVELAPA